jgi:hypothetical protein
MPSVLGGSPLGLLMVNAGQKEGFATFNSTTERSINVQNYNGQKNNAASSGYGNSLFSGARIVRAWPGISEYSTSEIPGLGDIDALKDGGIRADNDPKFKPRRNLHNNDVYDTTILNIIDNLKGTKAMLKMADFAYLKNLGVYPNNRLMVARRFTTAQTDNIYKNLARAKSGAISEINPMAVLISWVTETDNFLDISFGEKWTEAKASFTDILNSIGGDITSKASTVGSFAESGGGLLPLPGFTEIFQRQFLSSIGILNEGAGSYIPSGNPNLIKEAKVRQTIGYDTAGSGLECTVSIKMECEYEQKFISGLDPTIVWMDLIGNITRFATSPSINYGLSGAAGNIIGSILNNPMGFVRHIVDKIKAALNKVANELVGKIREKVNKIKAEVAAKKQEEAESPTPEGQTVVEKVKSALEQKLEAAKDELAQAANFVSENVGGFIEKALKGLAMKYRVEIMGVVNALSGLPSTPWHITIGNPMRPVFCAGDMYMREAMNLTLGPVLAFNDLPASIKATFTLTNARPWGMQEIMAKFNSGYIRSVDVQKSFYETAYIYDPNSGTEKTEKAGNFPYDYENAESETTISGSVSNSNNATNVIGGSVSNPAMSNFLAKKQEEEQKLKDAKKQEEEQKSTAKETQSSRPADDVVDRTTNQDAVQNKLSDIDKKAKEASEKKKIEEENKRIEEERSKEIISKGGLAAVVEQQRILAKQNAEKQKLESTVDNSKTNEGKQTKEDEPNFSGGDDYYNYKLGIQ